MSLFEQPVEQRAVRCARYEDEPGFYEPAGLWLYGNIRLLHANLAFIPSITGVVHFTSSELASIEKEAERIVLAGQILVCGIHNEGHMRSAIVPLRWGSPRIVVFSGGFEHHLGPDLSTEPFRAARLWRYGWDAKTDLAVSRRAPEKKPTYAFDNPTVDRLIRELATGTKQGLRTICDSLTPLLECSS